MLAGGEARYDKSEEEGEGQIIRVVRNFGIGAATSSAMYHVCHFQQGKSR